ncbi:hypothetical protein TNCV_2333281 [Trichonephila clavipes]|nr:hypothetical protein TNCV_2333281 [Trichonephila clavipes]
MTPELAPHLLTSIPMGGLPLKIHRVEAPIHDKSDEAQSPHMMWCECEENGMPPHVSSSSQPSFGIMRSVTKFPIGFDFDLCSTLKQQCYGDVPLNFKQWASNENDT